MKNQPQQQVLAITLPFEPSFDNFVVGDNAELLQALDYKAAPPVQPGNARAMATDKEFHGIWLAGHVQSGRTHLLQAACHQRLAAGDRCVYIALERALDDPAEVMCALEAAAEFGAVVALDNMAYLTMPTASGWTPGLILEAQDLVLAIYQRLLVQGGLLCAAHTQPAVALDFARDDLASRMRSLAHFQLAPLDDAAKKALLKTRAKRLGYTLDDAVLNYWFTHGPRATGALLRDLDILDTASLASKNPVTVPLLKQVLKY